MTIDDSFSEQDKAALAFCVDLLKSDPNCDYKEARREARVSQGLSVRRQVWGAARRQCGVGPRDEVVAADVLGDAAPQESPPPDGQERSSEQDTPQARGQDAPRGQDTPQARGRDDAPAARNESPRRDEGRRHSGRRDDDWRRNDRPGNDRPRDDRQRDDGFSHQPDRRDSEPQWPSGRKPAWATPKPEKKEPAPSPTSMFLAPARNPIEFMVQYLKTTNAEASFDEVRNAAEDAGFTVYPATFGRAQALAGLLDDEVSDEPIRIAPTSSPPAAVPTAAPATTPTTGPQPAAQPAKKTAAASAPGGIDPIAGMQAFISAMGKTQRDRDVLKKRIASMLDVVNRALKP